MRCARQASLKPHGFVGTRAPCGYCAFSTKRKFRNTASIRGPASSGGEAQRTFLQDQSADQPGSQRDGPGSVHLHELTDLAVEAGRGELGGLFDRMARIEVLQEPLHTFHAFDQILCILTLEQNPRPIR